METKDQIILVGNDPVGREVLKLQNKFIKPVVSPQPMKQLARNPPKVGRNEPCPCGSGKKFKRCCLNPPPKNRRKVEVFRMDGWREVRLTEVRKGERFRMFEGGRPVKDNKGHLEWIAATNGFINGLGVGAIEVVRDLSKEQKLSKTPTG